MAEQRSLVVIALEVIFSAVNIMVGPIPALITAAIALGTFNNSIYLEDYNTYRDETRDSVDELRHEIYTAAGIAIAVSSLGIIIKLPLVLFYFLTIFYNFVNMKIKLLHIVDIVTSFVLAGGHAVSGIVLIVFSNTGDWSNLQYYDPSTIKFIISAMTASGAFSFISTVLFVAVAVFMLIFFVVNDCTRTRAITPTAQTQAMPNEPEEQEIHTNDETATLIT